MEDHVRIVDVEKQVPLLHLDTYGPDAITGIPESKSALAWLHREKLPLSIYPNDSRKSLHAAYERELPKFRRAFKSLLSGRSFDLLLQAPSSKPHAKTFTDAARELHSDIPLIVFSKPSEVSATKGASVAEIMGALSHQPQVDFQGYSHVLVVDDVFNEGKTVAAMIRQLQESGLDPTANITVAAPLYVRKAPSAALSR